MRTLPRTADYLPELLVIRTDYHDEQAWNAVQAALAEPWPSSGGEASVQEVLCVDDGAWAGASVDEVLAALVSDDGECGGVFIADEVTTKGSPGHLLAVNTEASDRDDLVREFRIEPRQAPHDVHCNLSLGNMDFEDFAPWFRR